ncbi:MAG: hypothetical protein WCX88_04145 [Patescibacteria group bacterium]
MKFHEGQRVQCIIRGTVIYNAKIRIEKRPYICQNQEPGNSPSNKLGYKYGFVLDNNFEQYELEELKPLETHQERLKKAEKLLKRAKILK